ncbi:MAG: hypothetical protein AAFY26_26805 [Cyanobacteria bacterium J06638_22]
MSAIRSSQLASVNAPPPTDAPPPTKVVRRKRRRARAVSPAHPHRAMAWEIGSKLGICLTLLAIVTTGLVQLVPRAIAQQAQLKEIEQEVLTLDARVGELQTDFNYRFDPHQAQRIMQEQSNRVAPGQVQVIWLDPSVQQADAMPVESWETPSQHP